MLKLSSKKTDRTAIVTGAGGFIGSHFTRFLKEKGYFVIGIDVKAPEFSVSCADQFILADLRDIKSANQYIRHCNELYMFAANMGGIGYIERIHALVMRDNVMINANCLEAARLKGLIRFFSLLLLVYTRYLSKNQLNLIQVYQKKMYILLSLNQDMVGKNYSAKICVWHTPGTMAYILGLQDSIIFMVRSLLTKAVKKSLQRQYAEKLHKPLKMT